MTTTYYVPILVTADYIDRLGGFKTKQDAVLNLINKMIEEKLVEEWSNKKYLELYRYWLLEDFGFRKGKKEIENDSKYINAINCKSIKLKELLFYIMMYTDATDANAVEIFGKEGNEPWQCNIQTMIV